MTGVSAAEAFPLAWPAGWPRTTRRGQPRYKVTMGVARTDLLHELQLMGATNVVISSNVPVRRDGLLYADAAKRRIDDPGVAVYFVRNGHQQVIACDKWDDVSGNVRAVGLTVAALRGIARAGATELLDRAFTGFKALPAPATVNRPWWDVLDVPRTADWEAIVNARRRAAMACHPDRGGSPEAMTQINRAWEEAKAEKGARGAA